VKIVRNADLMTAAQASQEFVPVASPNIPGLERREPASSRPATGETIVTIAVLALAA
jgi:hypothetical protein